MKPLYHGAPQKSRGKFAQSFGPGGDPVCAL